MATLTSKIRKIIDKLEEIEIQEATLTKQLEKVIQKKEKLQQKLQDLINKTNSNKNSSGDE